MMKMNIYEKKATTKADRIKHVIKQWGNSTTAHGIGNILRAKSIFVKILWLIFFIASTIYCIYQVYVTIIQFLANEVITVQKITYESPSKFPAVDICNLNSFEGIHVNNLFDENGNFRENLTELTFIEAKLEHWKNETFQSGDILVHLAGKNKSFPLELIPKMIIEKSLVYCRFQGKPCDYNDFGYYFNQIYGNCFTFNLGKKDPIKYVFRSGIDDGLKIELLVSSYWFESELIFKDGIQVVVYNQSLESFPEEEGISAQFDSQNNIAISRKFLTRLSQPYSDCIKHSDPNSFLNEFKFEKYTQKFCLKSCLQFYLVQKCFCFDSRLPKPEKNVTRCKLDLELECIEIEKDLFYNTQKNNECFAKCPSECEKIIINKQYFLAPLPKKKNVINPLNDLILQNSYYSSKNIKINVFYDEMDYERVDEYPSMTFETLVSDIGGSLGLFIGISLLSMAELVEIFLNIFYVLIG